MMGGTYRQIGGRTMQRELLAGDRELVNTGTVSAKAS
jgi:hypothetical protein